MAEGVKIMSYMYVYIHMQVCVCVCVCVCILSFLFPVGERIKAICSSMDEPWGHYAKEINHTEKDNMYNIIYMWNLQQLNS